MDKCKVSSIAEVAKAKDIREVLDYGYVTQLRTKYKNNCVGLCDDVQNVLSYEGVPCTALMFKCISPFMNPICIYDSVNKTFKKFTHHAVILVGTTILDVAMTDKIISLSGYLNYLEDNNDQLKLDSRSGVIGPDNVYYTVTTIKELRDYIKDCEEV